MLANFGERYRVPRLLTLIAGGVLAGLFFLVGLAGALLQIGIFSSGGEKFADFRQAEQTLLPFAVAGALGLLYLMPAIQRAVARVLPLQPGSPVLYLTVVLGLLLVAQQVGTQIQQQVPLTYGELLAQDVPFFILAFVGVGIFIRRTPKETVERLGLVPPVRNYWWLIALAGIVVFLVVAYGIEAVANVVAPEQQKKVTDVSNVLFSHFNNPAAIIFLGVLAGVVEETLFRGAMQPRLGIVITSILFAALHTQYAVSFATLEVLVLGVGLGLLRKYSGSTVTGMVTHAGYDIAVGLIPFIIK
ncbi:MAG TPA: CPBP family intramembrane glutamic endopeptidase [Candidatus Acidoferrum sp.]|nr:CPBP family intramembrane glutamic endopeptidase [Candidatus Acidoferrum sp.]